MLLQFEWEFINHRGRGIAAVVALETSPIFAIVGKMKQYQNNDLTGEESLHSEPELEGGIYHTQIV